MASSDPIGYLVSVKCCGNGGVYQGTVSDANPNSLTLKKAFWNGLPYEKPFVTLNGSDIVSLTIIGEKEESVPKSTIDKAECKKEQMNQVKRTGRCAVSDHIKINTIITPPQMNKTKNVVNNKQTPTCGNQAGPSKSKPIDIHNRNRNHLNGNNITGNRRDKYRKKNEDCFGSSSDDPSIHKDFDFEKNLALFDKNAVLEELKLRKPDLLEELNQQSGGSLGATPHSLGNYRHDENILSSNATAELDSVTVPTHLSGEINYITDQGLRVQSVSRAVKSRMWELLASNGLLEASQTLLARAVADLALRLLGGARRLDPLNCHQKPSVIVLAGAHRTGLAGIHSARMLLSHGCGATVYLCEGSTSSALQSTLKQFRMAGGSIVYCGEPRNSNRGGVDLILMAMQAGDMVPNDILQARAQKVLIDPPEYGVDCVEANITVAAGLALAYRPSCGKIHLSNIAVPKAIFMQLDVEYRSPFGAKTLIPLHMDSL